MLGVVAEHSLRPLLDRTFPLAEGVDAPADLARGDQFGELALRSPPDRADAGSPGGSCR